MPGWRWCSIPHEKEMVRAVVARIIGYSLLTAGLGVLIGVAIFGINRDRAGLGFVLACVGAIVGSVAGVAGEIATAQRRIKVSEWQKKLSERCEALE
jgi:hypothetical protein